MEKTKNFKRRSISLPIELDEIISIKFKKTNYSFVNDFLVELLELGLIKLDEDIEIKNKQIEILNKIDNILCPSDLLSMFPLTADVNSSLTSIEKSSL